MKDLVKLPYPTATRRFQSIYSGTEANKISRKFRVISLLDFKICNYLKIIYIFTVMARLAKDSFANASQALLEEGVNVVEMNAILILAKTEENVY